VTAQQPLPDIDWADVCGDDEEPERQPARYERDLDGQGLDPAKRHTMTTIKLSGSEYL
jgi:hypothetical protein